MRRNAIRLQLQSGSALEKLGFVERSNPTASQRQISIVALESEIKFLFNDPERSALQKLLQDASSQLHEESGDKSEPIMVKNLPWETDKDSRSPRMLEYCIGAIVLVAILAVLIRSAVGSNQSASAASATFSNENVSRNVPVPDTPQTETDNPDHVSKETQSEHLDVPGAPVVPSNPQPVKLCKITFRLATDNCPESISSEGLNPANFNPTDKCNLHGAKLSPKAEDQFRVAAIEWVRRANEVTDERSVAALMELYGDRLHVAFHAIAPDQGASPAIQNRLISKEEAKEALLTYCRQVEDGSEVALSWTLGTAEYDQRGPRRSPRRVWAVKVLASDGSYEILDWEMLDGRPVVTGFSSFEK